MASPLLRFLGGHLLVGVIVGWGALGAFIWLDIGRLGSLVLDSPDWPLVLAMLLVVFAITFGSLAMGTGVMGLGRKAKDAAGDKPPGGTPALDGMPRPAYAKAEARRRRA